MWSYCGKLWTSLSYALTEAKPKPPGFEQNVSRQIGHSGNWGLPPAEASRLAGGDGCWDNLHMNHITEHLQGREEGLLTNETDSRRNREVRLMDFHPFIQPVDTSC